MDAAALTTALVVAAGFAIARAAVRERQRPLPWLDALAWAPAVGLGGLSLIHFLWRFVELPAAGRGSVLALTLIAALALLLGRRRPRVPSERQGRDVPETAPERVPPLLLWPIRIGLAATILGLVVAFARWSELRPYGTADAINIWNVRARFLLFAHEPLPELFAAMKRGSHPDYPLMLPGSVAAQAGFWGDWNQAIPQATGAAFLFGLGTMTFVGLRRLGSGHLAAAGAAVVLSAPIVWRWAFSQCADLPVAYLGLAAGVGLATRLEPRPPTPVSPLLAGFALGLLVWTKHEGALLALALVGVFLALRLVGPGSFGAKLRDLPAIAVGAAPGAAALVLFKVWWAPPGAASLFLGGGSGSQLFDLERWREVLTAVGAAVVAHAADWRWLAVFLVLAAATLATRTSLSRPASVFLIASLVLTFAGYLVAYVLSPYPTDWHVSKSLGRLLLQLLPLAVLWVLSLSRPAAEVTGGSRATSAALPAPG